MNNTLHTFVVLAYKKSDYLECCLNSVLNQTYKSKVVIATTTINNHIKEVAKKYNIKIIDGKHTNIGGDFDFAKNSASTPLVTVAHQDDIYNKNYSKEIIDAYNKSPDSNIIFTDYYEIRDDKKIYKNKNLNVKRKLLSPLKLKKISNIKFAKQLSICFGNSISCPAVSFVKKNVPNDLFTSNYKSNVDWFAWEKLSKMPGRFTYINKKLMGHRISEESETTKIINSGERTNEDYKIFRKFWPKPIALFLAKLYKKAEDSNNVN